MDSIEAEAIALPDGELHNIHTRDSLKTPELSRLHYLVHLEGGQRLSTIACACIPAAADGGDVHLMRTLSTFRGRSSSKNVL
jgi:hypothetical protein